jgi:hypothetical protein
MKSITSDIDAQSTTSTTPKEHNEAEHQHNKKEKLNHG